MDRIYFEKPVNNNRTKRTENIEELGNNITIWTRSTL